MNEIAYLGTEWRNGILFHIFNNGKSFPVVAGGSEGEKKEGDDSGDESEEDESEEDEDDEEEEDTKDDPKAHIESLKRGNDRLSKKLGQKDKIITDMSKRLKTIEDKDKTDSQKKDEEVKTLEIKVSSLEEETGRLKVENKLLKRSDLAGLPQGRRDLIVKSIIGDMEVEEDGEDNVEDLLTALRESDPGLFETPDDADEEDEEKEKKPPKTGGAKKKKDKTGVPERKVMEDRFPALKRHR